MPDKRLIDLIPHDILKAALNHPYCELEPDHLCFEFVYRAVADNVPKDFTVLDLGCYMAAQAYLFTEHRLYVGVDNSEFIAFNHDWYVPPPRFSTKNSVHYTMSITDFLDWCSNAAFLDPERTYVVASYVPGFYDAGFLGGRYPNHAIIYPGHPECINGINANAIYAEYKKLKSMALDFNDS